MKGQPIRPDEVVGVKGANIPDDVFDAFNLLITENFNRGSATIKQEDVVALLVAKGYTSAQLFRNGWLDVEPIYEREGWRVVYDKPAYNEDYDATFTFRVARR